MNSKEEIQKDIDVTNKIDKLIRNEKANFKFLKVSKNSFKFLLKIDAYDLEIYIFKNKLTELKGTFTIVINDYITRSLVSEFLIKNILIFLKSKYNNLIESNLLRDSKKGLNDLNSYLKKTNIQ